MQSSNESAHLYRFKYWIHKIEPTARATTRANEEKYRSGCAEGFGRKRGHEIRVERRGFFRNSGALALGTEFVEASLRDWRWELVWSRRWEWLNWGCELVELAFAWRCLSCLFFFPIYIYITIVISKFNTLQKSFQFLPYMLNIPSM